MILGSNSCQLKDRGQDKVTKIIMQYFIQTVYTMLYLYYSIVTHSPNTLYTILKLHTPYYPKVNSPPIPYSKSETLSTLHQPTLPILSLQTHTLYHQHIPM